MPWPTEFESDLYSKGIITAGAMDTVAHEFAPRWGLGKAIEFFAEAQPQLFSGQIQSAHPYGLKSTNKEMVK